VRVQKGLPALSPAFVKIGTLAYDVLGILLRISIGGPGEQIRWTLVGAQVLKFRHDFEGCIRHRNLAGKLIDQFR